MVRSVNRPINWNLSIYCFATRYFCLPAKSIYAYGIRYAAVGGVCAINPSRLRSKHIECAAHIERLGAYRKSRKGFIATKKATRMGGFFLFSVGDKPGDIFQLAIQILAQFIQGLGLHVFVGFQPADSFTVYTALLPEHIGADTFSRHQFPQPIKTNHDFTPLAFSYYGGYNLIY